MRGTVHIFPTAKLPGAGTWASISQIANVLEKFGETKSSRLEREKRMVRGARMDPANDSEFEPKGAA